MDAMDWLDENQQAEAADYEAMRDGLACSVHFHVQEWSRYTDGDDFDSDDSDGDGAGCHADSGGEEMNMA